MHNIYTSLVIIFLYLYEEVYEEINKFPNWKPPSSIENRLIVYGRERSRKITHKQKIKRKARTHKR